MVSALLKKLRPVLSVLQLSFFLVACGGGGGGGGSDGGVGTLSTSLTDVSTHEYRAVYVTVARVDVHPGGDDAADAGWRTVAEPNQTFNLLELVNGVRSQLGKASLDAGHYSQLRLIIGLTPDSGLNIFSQAHPFANYIVDQDDNEIHELKVPSGLQTGLKIVNGFDINENRTTELILDFDAMRSVVKAGASGQYLLKPTVKVLDTDEYALVNGLVVDTPLVTVPPADPVPLAGAMVTAQAFDSSADDVKDWVVVSAGTLADENGEYSLLLMPGEYNLVAVQAGFLPGCTAVGLTADSVNTVDFSLVADDLDPGFVAGNISIAGGAEDQHTTIDFRQEVSCGGGLPASMVSVKTVNVAAGDYTVELPAGDYQVVVSSFGMTTLSASVTVISTGTTENVSFALIP